jgi:CubicO group peptidase (beta-lactamase class C family)
MMLDTVRQLVESGIAAGQHSGAILYAMIDGQAVAELAIGEARPGVPLSSSSILLWMSSCKPIGATAILQMVERDRLSLDDTVATHLPEFGANGKEQVTIRHLLTHTGGFRFVDLQGTEFDWRQIVDRICAAPLERGWVPGANAGYHPATSWYVVGELIERLDGRPFSQYVREAIFLPLAMNDSWIGMSPQAIESYGDRIAPMWETEKGEPTVHRYSTPEGIMACIPGGNGHGSIVDLTRFYEMLRRGGELEGARILETETVRAMTRRQREGMIDATFRARIDFGLGLIVNSKRYGAKIVPYGYGELASENTFGHSGSQSSAAFCDPERKLVVAIVFCGMPGEARHQKRIDAVLTALYPDLELL